MALPKAMSSRQGSSHPNLARAVILIGQNEGEKEKRKKNEKEKKEQQNYTKSKNC